MCHRQVPSATHCQLASCRLCSAELLLLANCFANLSYQRKQGTPDAEWLQQQLDSQQLDLTGYNISTLLQLAGLSSSREQAGKLMVQIVRQLLSKLDAQPDHFVQERDMDELILLCTSVGRLLSADEAAQVTSALFNQPCLHPLWSSIQRVVSALSIMSAWRVGQSKPRKPPPSIVISIQAADVYLQDSAQQISGSVLAFLLQSYACLAAGSTCLLKQHSGALLGVSQQHDAGRANRISISLWQTWLVVG